MKINEIKLKEIFRNRKINISDLEDFSNILKIFLSKIERNQREEHLKYFFRDFLKKTFYRNNAINTKGNFDFAIHKDESDKSKLEVIIETKTPESKEMITENNFSVKSMYQILLYFFQERINNKNNDLKNIVITNFYEYFIFDASDFEKLFYENKDLKKEFENWNNDKKTSKKTNLFYEEIAPKYIKDIEKTINFTHLNIENINTKISENQKELAEFFKIFSPEFLLKKTYINDSNTLNEEFYYELLYIIGLEEVSENGKKIIVRSKKEYGSMIENAISIINLEERYREIENVEEFGDNKDEQIENIAIELVILWTNRILFLKLMEAQLLTYQKLRNDKDYKFLNIETIKDFNKLNEIFFAVLAKKLNERPENLEGKFKKIPYLNSSLFEISKLERKAIRISSLSNDLKLPLFKKTVLKHYKSEKILSIEYIFNFLDSFDFTSVGKSEIKKEQKNLINASVLGLIFEKINGYKEGSFFTPGYITMYICKKTIREAVLQKFANHRSFKNAKNFDDLKDLIEDRSKANEIINTLKICDPAVGSGHFLVSALNEIIAIKSELGILQYKNGHRIKNYRAEIFNDELIITDNDDDEIFAYNLSKKGNAIKEKQDLQEAIFHEKEKLIESCVFGVDININSVNICRLRLWIELLKNSYYTKESNYKELRVLPNIDINIKKGNSLISKFAISGNGIANGQIKKIRMSTRKYKEQVIIYKSTSDKITKQNAEKEISRIKEEFAEIVNPTDENFKLLRILKTKLLEETSKSPVLMTEKDRKIWKHNLNNLPIEIDKLEEKYNKNLKNLFKNTMEWRFEFPEVLDENGNFEGFDIVMGNPPYISYYGNTGDRINETERQYFFKNYKNLKKINERINAMNLFIELGKQISKKDAHVNFILNKTFSVLPSYTNIRKYVLEQTKLNYFITDLQPFSIIVDCCILGFQNKKNDKNYDFKIINNDFKTKNIFNIELFKNNRNNIFKAIFNPNILEKINSVETKLDDFVLINRGVNIGGCFADFLSEKKINKKYKKYISGTKCIKPYIYNWEKEDGYMVFDKKIENKLRKKGKTLALGQHKRFKNKKLFIPESSQELMAVYSNELCYSAYGIMVATKKNKDIKLKVVLAFLNSKLLRYYVVKYEILRKGKKATPHIGVKGLRSIPIPVINISNQIKIINLVNEIIDLKENKENTDHLENKLNYMIYKSYNLTKKEIKIIENETI